MGRISFTTTLEPRGPAAAVVLDEEQVATVGQGAKSFPVKATVNGYSWRGRVSSRRASSCSASTRKSAPRPGSRLARR